MCSGFAWGASVPVLLRAFLSFPARPRELLVEPPARAATLRHGSLSTAQRHPPERDPMDTSGGWLHPTAGTCWGSTGIHRVGSTGKRGRAALGTLCFGAGHWCLQEAGVWGEPAWCRKVPV